MSTSTTTQDQAHELLWQALELIHDAGADTDTCTVANGMLHEAGRLIGHKRAAIALDALRWVHRQSRPAPTYRARVQADADDAARHAAVFGSELAGHHRSEWDTLYAGIMAQGGIRLGHERSDYSEDIPVCLRRNSAPYALDQFAHWAGYEYTDDYVAMIATTYRNWKQDREGVAA